MHIEGFCKRIAMLLASRVLPSLLKCWRKKDYKAPIKTNLIVSFTSFPARINTLWEVVASMFMQTLQPELLVLYLSKEQFPNTYDDLPQSLLRLQEYSLRIEFVEEDYRSHKKYYYALADYPNAYIVTIDDDILYHSSLLENLYKEAVEKKCVVCNWARKMMWDNSVLKSYTSWPVQDKKTVEDDINLFLLSGGGTIFPPSSLYEDVRNKELFLSLTPRADDIWLNAMLRLKGTSISRISRCYAPLPIACEKDNTLWMTNITENDKQISAIDSYYQQQGKSIWNERNTI